MQLQPLISICEMWMCVPNPFSESPAEKRPVVSLTEDEARPSVSVLNIFKQVKYLTL